MGVINKIESLAGIIRIFELSDTVFKICQSLEKEAKLEAFSFKNIELDNMKKIYYSYIYEVINALKIKFKNIPEMNKLNDKMNDKYAVSSIDKFLLGSKRSRYVYDYYNILKSYRLYNTHPLIYEEIENIENKNIFELNIEYFNIIELHSIVRETIESIKIKFSKKDLEECETKNNKYILVIVKNLFETIVDLAKKNKNDNFL